MAKKKNVLTDTYNQFRGMLEQKGAKGRELTKQAYKNTLEVHPDADSDQLDDFRLTVSEQLANDYEADGMESDQAMIQAYKELQGDDGNDGSQRLNVYWDMPEIEDWLLAHNINFLYDIIVEKKLIQHDGKLWYWKEKFDLDLIVRPIQRLYAKKKKFRPSAEKLMGLLRKCRQEAAGYSEVLDWADRFDNDETHSTEAIKRVLAGFDCSEFQQSLILTGLCQAWHIGTRINREASAILRDENMFAETPFVVVFHGRQGFGKSSIVEFFGSFLENEKYIGQMQTFKAGDNDNDWVNTSQWLCEIPEIGSFTLGHTVDEVKRFFSRKYRKFRKPYAEEPEDKPTVTSFWGNCNDQFVLTDPTGDRRFGMVEVGPNFGWWNYTPDPTYYKKLVDEERECEVGRKVFDRELCREMWHEIHWLLRREETSGLWRTTAVQHKGLKANNAKYRWVNRKVGLLQKLFNLPEEWLADSAVPVCDKPMTMTEAVDAIMAVMRMLIHRGEGDDYRNITEDEVKKAIKDSWVQGTYNMHVRMVNHNGTLKFYFPYFSNKVRQMGSGDVNLLKYPPMQTPTERSLQEVKEAAHKPLVQPVKAEYDALAESGEKYNAQKEEVLEARRKFYDALYENSSSSPTDPNPDLAKRKKVEESMAKDKEMDDLEWDRFYKECYDHTQSANESTLYANEEQVKRWKKEVDEKKPW